MIEAIMYGSPVVFGVCMQEASSLADSSTTCSSRAHADNEAPGADSRHPGGGQETTADPVHGGEHPRVAYCNLQS